MHIAPSSIRKERLLVLLTALSVLMSMMIIVADPALAHHPVIGASDYCDDAGVLHLDITASSWTYSPTRAGNHDDVRVQVQLPGSSDWTEVGSGGFMPADPYRSFTVGLDGSSVIDPADLPETTLGSLEGQTLGIRTQVRDTNGSTPGAGWYDDSNNVARGGTGNGNSDTTMQLTLTECEPPVDQEVSVSVTTGECRTDMTWGSETELLITIEPGSGATVTIDHPDDRFDGVYTESASVWLPYGRGTWSAEPADGFEIVGPSSGEFQIGIECLSCPTYPEGTIVVDFFEMIRADRNLEDARKGPIATNVPAGFYDVTLSSWDEHTAKPGQRQDREQYYLEGWNGGSEAGWNSGVISDLPDDINFLTETVDTDVFIPNLDSFFVVHPAYPDSNAQSVAATCVAFTPVTHEVEVSVGHNSCDVNDAGEAVGSVDVAIDPSAGATVSVYSDAEMTDFVGSFSGSGGSQELAPGTYYWDATASAGFTLSGETSGSFTIEPCEASVVVTSGECAMSDDGSPLGLVQVALETEDSAQVDIYDEADDSLVASFTGDGDALLPPGSYYWTASSQPGFELTGPTSGDFVIEPCGTTVEVIGECVIGNDTQSGVIHVLMSMGMSQVQIHDGQSVIETLHESGTVAVPEGKTYSWIAFAETGFAIDGADEGAVDIEDCVQPVAVVVTHGDCVPDTFPNGFVAVEIEPALAAMVSVFDSNGDLAVMFDSTGSAPLGPGSYTWTAEAGEAYDLADDGFAMLEAMGGFTIEPCPDEVLPIEVLPFTGADADIYLSFGLILLIAGAYALRFARRLDEN